MHETTADATSAPLARRDFVKLTTFGVAGALLGGGARPIIAGPFGDTNEYLEVVDEDKKLDPAWLRSLFERGEKEVVVDRAALERIGMPVGGLFAGTVYLSGDGRLWLWDIFNRDQEGIRPRTVSYRGENVPTRNGANVIEAARPFSPFRQGFAIRVGERTHTLDGNGFADVRFDGRYPIGRVSYRDPAVPVEVGLEAFSPFVPLRLDDSSLPATIMRFTVTNPGSRAVEVEVAGHLENAVCLDTGAQLAGRRCNRAIADERLSAVVCSAEPVPGEDLPSRPDVLFEDFEKPSYAGWTVEGDAFGAAPAEIDRIPDYQGDVAGRGRRVVNSHATAPGSSVTEKDSHRGSLTSGPFTIERRFIHLLVGGGAHRGTTCVDLLVDGEVVGSITGQNNNRMLPTAFNVARFEGRTARIRVVDEGTSGWGNIGVDHIVFSDRPPESGDLTRQRDFGTMALAVLGPAGSARVTASRGAPEPAAEATGDIADSLVGEVGRSFRIEPGRRVTADFVIAWHFPNFFSRGCGGRLVGHHYASRFDSALDVARHVAADFDDLAGTTRRWVETWYDSTLPYWLLDRTMANTSTLATTTCYRFRDGRFWAWEGIGCCAGTCTHVWHYAQAPGRLFPELERIERERVNFGIGLHADGGVGMRTGLEGSNAHADDGQCGRILGVLREHQMSADDSFLRRLWPNVKKALEFMIRRDGNADGVLEGAQPNTLDAAWYGKISFVSSLYLAALRAGEVLAREAGDPEFARECRSIADRGAKSILETFNGEYFVQIEDPAHSEAIGVGPGCYIDQVFGQSWAHWVGLGRLFDRDRQLSALRALWKYNFVPDVGAFRERFRRGRWYALAGDAGLVMCTWPRGGENPNFRKHWQYGYFNECMTGFEWQVAAHMVWEGHDQPDLLEHGLAIARAIHDRYNAALRNPYNEVECSDHYARAMASYGVFQAVCGYEYDGPRGVMAFSPRLPGDGFRAVFTAAEGWGSIAQARNGDEQTQSVEVREGRLRLRELAFDVATGVRPAKVTAVAGDRALGAALVADGRRVRVRFDSPVVLEAGESLRVSV